MKILLVGCSFATGDHSWAKIIRDWFPGSKIVAFPGAGNRWISSVVRDYVIKNRYDLVLVMWSGYTRLDVPTSWAKKHLRKYEFCPTKNSFGSSTTDWICSGALNGSWSGSQDLTIKSLFELLYLEIDHEIAAYMTLSEILSTQSLLKCLDIPYFFMTYINYWDSNRSNVDLQSWYYDTDLSIDRFESLRYLTNSIDWDQWIFDQGKNGIYERCHGPQDLAEDKLHPGNLVQQHWAETILNRIKSRHDNCVL